MEHRNLTIQLAIIVLFCCSGRVFPDCQTPAAGSWEEAAPLPEARDEICASVHDGKLYVFGGHNDCGRVYPNLCSRTEVYDPSTNSWSRVASMPTGRGQAAAAVVNGVIYVIGGNNCFSNCWLTMNEAYNPTSNKWTSKAAMPTRRGGLTAIAVMDRIYAMGGADSYKKPSTYGIVEVYDASSNSWSRGNAMPRRRAHHAAVEYEGKIYLFGGSSDESGTPSLVEAVDVYDLEQDSWSTVSRLPNPRSLLMGVVLGNRIYAIGGADASSAMSAVEFFDLDLGCWHSSTPLPTARHSGSAASLNGKVYVVGGSNNNTLQDANEVLTSEAFFFIRKAKQPDSVSVVLQNTLPVRAGTVCLWIDPAVMSILALLPGSRLPEGAQVYMNTSVLDSSGRTVPGAAMLGWLNSLDKDVILPPGEHEVLQLKVALIASQASSGCANVRFVEQLRSSVDSPPQVSIVTDNDGRTIVATTMDGELCLCSPLLVPSQQPPSGQEDVPYEFCLIVQGGLQPNTCSLMSGILPPGLVLDPSCCLNGTPTIAGNYAFTLEVCDSCVNGQQCVVIDLAMEILPPCTPVDLPSADLPPGEVGREYFAQLEVQDGIAPFTCTVTDGNLPPGLELRCDTVVVIQGIPTKEAEDHLFEFTLEVCDSCPAGPSCDQARFKLPIERHICLDPTIAMSNLGRVVIGKPYNDMLVAQKGEAPFDWSIVSGHLPLGLTLDAETGSVSGTPSSCGAFTFTARVCDSCINGSNCATKEVTLQVVDIQISTVSVPKTVMLSKKKPSKSKAITVKLKNKCPGLPIVIEDRGMLEQVVTVSIRSLGTCPAPSATVRDPKKFPLVLKQKAKEISFDVTINCPNDPIKNSRKDKGHEDYTYTVVLHPSALDRANNPALDVVYEAPLSTDVVMKEK